MKRLDLSSNCIGNDGLLLIWECIGRIQNLSLVKCGLTAAGIKGLPIDIGEANTVSYLSNSHPAHWWWWWWYFSETICVFLCIFHGSFTSVSCELSPHACYDDAILLGIFQVVVFFGCGVFEMLIVVTEIIFPKFFFGQKTCSISYFGVLVFGLNSTKAMWSFQWTKVKIPRSTRHHPCVTWCVTWCRVWFFQIHTSLHWVCLSEVLFSNFNIPDLGVTPRLHSQFQSRPPPNW